MASLARAIELNPKLSKAYQLIGEAYETAGQRDRAIEVVTQGVSVADAQGDRMPRDAMASLLREWGAPVPEFKSAERPGTDSASPSEPAGFQCVRCGRPSGKLEKAPFKGDLGAKIHENVCNLCWREWIEMGTKVINELGLVLSTTAGQEAYDQYMIEFLQLEDR